MEYKKINKQKMSDFFNMMKNNGVEVMAPVQKKDKVFFASVSSYDDVAKDYVQTGFSAKSVVFPKCEELFSYEKVDGETKVNNPDPGKISKVVFGSRPCDSAGFDYLSVFFLNENPDFHFKKRYDSTILISISCSKADEYCFCTSVGLSPDDSKGSDILLTDSGKDFYYAEIVSDKGKAFVGNYSAIFENSESFDKKALTAKIEKKFNSDDVRNKIKGAFNWDKWEESSLACFGCGTCAFSCPTCTCFDIQDESNLAGGSRLRLWDTCALGIFTKHASGHNPRETQSNRWRNRVLHKFEYTSEQFGMLSCVGCGRCSRNCPAQLSIVEQINMILEA